MTKPHKAPPSGDRSRRVSHWPNPTISRGRSLSHSRSLSLFLMIAILRFLSGEVAASQSPAAAHSPDCRQSLIGQVIDLSSGRPIVQAALRIEELGRTVFTDSLGLFEFGRLCPGSYTLEIIHVAFLPSTQPIEFEAGADPVRLAIELTPRVYKAEEVLIQTTAVAPLTSIERPGHTFAPVPMREFVSRDLADAVELIPGVTVSGNRPFFRGIGFEQLQPLIDGVSAREPITGQWLLPPPQSVSSAELLSGAMVAESGQSLGGVVSFRLAEGDDSRQTRLTYGSDGLGNLLEGPRRTDIAAVSGSGPTTIPGLYYSGSWQGRATDGYLTYSSARPSQSILGLVPIGSRMQGRNTASLKLTWRPEKSPWKATGALVSLRSREKTYHHHYSRSGWVGYIPRFDRYTTFEDSESGPALREWYEGPQAVPTEEQNSTLTFLTLTRNFGAKSWVTLHGLYGHHRLHTQAGGPRISDDRALKEWIGQSLTSIRHQEEEFYSVHGDLPEFESGRSNEAGIGGTGSVRIVKDHEFRFGIGLVGGQHQYVSIAPPLLIGSFHNDLSALDGYGYLEDIWYSDSQSWMQIALRYNFRRVGRSGRSWFGSRWAPVLAFHQPMTHADALHVQTGVTYQLPPLKGHFAVQTEAESDSDLGLDLKVQRMRFFEVGMQHHFAKTAVGYLGAYQREYSDVVFSTRSPGVLESLSGVRSLAPQFLEASGFEAVLDHQFHHSLVGQASAVLSKTSQEDVEVPWSRRLVIRNWLSWISSRGFAATMSNEWNSGRPYSTCLAARGCPEDELRTGRLPWHLETDLAVRWRREIGGINLELRAEVFNVLDRRIPIFDFSVYPMEVGSSGFLAYYDETGETGGYAIDYGDLTAFKQRTNPETRTAGRSALLSLGLLF